MTQADAPFVSVITVNFNGRDHLLRLLYSLEKQTYENFEVLVVDNGSQDGSAAAVRERFPRVRVIEAGRNLGFAAGNNLGMEESQGSYLALINNDATVHPRWLETLVGEALSSPVIGAVGPKILFARPFFPVTLEIDSFCPEKLGISPDARELGVFVAESSGFAGCDYAKTLHDTGFHAPEVVSGRTGRWTTERATVFLPVQSVNHDETLILDIRGGGPRTRVLTIKAEGKKLAVTEVGSDWESITITVERDLLQQHGMEVVNNAASFLDADGNAGDRGLYESDQGQFDAPEDGTALCGCSMLIKRAALREVGLFDSDYFMYFEDTELSWRLRKAGYRLRYQPASIVRHVHAATSIEWSPEFTFFVTRNRLLMLLRHGKMAVAFKMYLLELSRTLMLLLSRRTLRDADLRTRVRVQRSLLRYGPRAVLKRAGILRDQALERDARNSRRQTIW